MHSQIAYARRAGGQCVEFIPVIGGGILESEPATSNSNQALAAVQN